MCWLWPEAQNQAKPSQKTARPSQALMSAFFGFSPGLSLRKPKLPAQAPAFDGMNFHEKVSAWNIGVFFGVK